MKYDQDIQLTLFCLQSQNLKGVMCDIRNLMMFILQMPSFFVFVPTNGFSFLFSYSLF